MVAGTPKPAGYGSVRCIPAPEWDSAPHSSVPPHPKPGTPKRPQEQQLLTLSWLPHFSLPPAAEPLTINSGPFRFYFPL
ncbi:hypothetical protein GDO81_016798 [Engystomops pustulosus]|uniref:Uncharacterized protein n=1 Tax=Engystomops pustulosus TaxID=76066 RepID=A0AAV7A909_ENGPU|nr:hypothetical protein GDO81_016798 [Engystomops pustulosus]